MTDSIQLTCVDFVDALASKEPAPGGGGTAALVGAIGCALGNMVGSLTVGKSKYADVENEIIELNERARSLEAELLAFVARDAEVFVPLSKVYGMPRETPEEKAARAAAMEACLLDCCAVPLGIMECCCKAIDLCEEYAVKGSRLAVSDAGCGVITLKAALQSAALNVYINTKSMADADKAAEFNEQADTMLAEYGAKADGIYASVAEGLRG